MSKILCPVDFSDSAMNAVQFASELAKTIGSELVLLHVEPAYAMLLKEGDDPLGVAGEKTSRLESIANALKDEKGIKVSCRVEYADLLTDIKEITSNATYGTIVMGTDGVSNIQQYHLGSNTAQVVKNTRCSLISVPDTYAYSKIKHVVFAVDNPGEGHKKVLDVIAFARLFDAEVTILHVDSPNEENRVNAAFKKELLGNLSSPEWLHFAELKSSDISKQIAKFMKEKNGSILATMTHNLSEYQSMFHKSITKELLETADFPVLVFHV